MLDVTILTITHEAKFLSLFRREVRDQLPGATRMIVAGTIEEACALVEAVRPRVIVAHWAREGGRYEQLDRLLWTTTVQMRQVPVIVIAERYRTDQATTMFRMGVTDYISRTHHIDRLGSVLSPYFPAPLVAAGSMVSAELAGQPANAWSAGVRETKSLANRAV